MRLKLKKSYLVVGLIMALSLVIRAQWPTPLEIPSLKASRPVSSDPNHLTMIGAIAVPPSLSSVDILWVDQARGRLYITDRTNQGIDIIDAVNDVYVGRIPGFLSSNGVLVTPDNKLWVGDSNSIVRVADLELNPPQIVQNIAIGVPADGRADELAYDPFDRVIMVANDASVPPRVNFISADTYAVLGTIPFPDASSAEQPVWSTQQHRFIINIAGPVAYEAVIDPKKMTITKKLTVDDCPNSLQASVGAGGLNGLSIEPTLQRLLVSACGFATIMSGLDGHRIVQYPDIGGDETWYNAGDGNFYVERFNGGAPARSLSAISAATGQLLSTIATPNGRNLAAYEGNNHVFVVFGRPAAGAVEISPCPSFGIVGTGCVGVFSHN